MDRRKFLRGIGIGAAAVVVAPVVVAEVLSAPVAAPMKGIIVSKARRKGMNHLMSGQVIQVSNGGWYYAGEMELMHQMMIDHQEEMWYGEMNKSKGGGI